MILTKNILLQCSDTFFCSIITIYIQLFYHLLLALKENFQYIYIIPWYINLSR
jgi:hypothetical protein